MTCSPLHFRRAAWSHGFYVKSVATVTYVFAKLAFIFRFAYPAYIGPEHTLLETKNGVRIVSSEINKTILHIAEREVVWDVPAKGVDLDTTYVVSHRVRLASCNNCVTFFQYPLF